MKITAFLLLMALLGLVLYKFRDFIDANARKQRITTYVVAACLLIAFASEYFFGVADITGAYLLGLFLSRNEIREEVEDKIRRPSYLVFLADLFRQRGPEGGAFPDLTAACCCFRCCSWRWRF